MTWECSSPVGSAQRGHSTSNPKSMSKPSVIARLKDRKIVQWALAYLAGAFVIGQALEVLEGPWNLPGRLVQAIHILLVAGLLMVLVIAWYHGEQGRQRVSRAELLIVALLLFLAGVSIRMMWSPRTEPGPGNRSLGGGDAPGAPVGGSGDRANVYRFSIPGPMGESLLLPGDNSFAISPDGGIVAFRWPREDGQWDLRVRRLDTFETQPLRGTEGAIAPFFSPDGEWVGFYSDGAIRKVALAGGSPQVIAASQPISTPRWAENDTLYFSAHPPTGGRVTLGIPGGLRSLMWKMPASGGEPLPLKSELLGPGTQEYNYYPEPVPGGHGLIYTGSATREFDVMVRDLRTGEDRVLIPSATAARLLPSGHLLYGYQGDLYSRSFDTERLEISGEPRLVAEGVAQIEERVWFDVSREGTLVFFSGGELEQEAAWFWIDPDAPSEPQEIPSTRRATNHVSISPEGDRMVYTMWEGRHHVAVVYDFRRGIGRTVSNPNMNAWGPHWLPDGERIAFGENSGDVAHLSWTLADGRGVPESLVDSELGQVVDQTTREGTILFHGNTVDSGQDIWEVDPNTGETRSWVGGPAGQIQGAFSPDREWIAYASSETGRFEVYVRKSDPDSVPEQVSVNGGRAPLWSNGGDRLYYRSNEGDTIWMVQPVVGEGEVSFSFPSVVLAGDFLGGGNTSQRGYDLAPDGRFLMRIAVGDYPAIGEIKVVVGWDLALGGQADDRR